MRVIAFIEDFKKILLRQTSPQALGLWKVKRKPPPQANAPPLIPNLYPTLRCRDEASLGEGRSVDDFVINADFAIVAYGYDS